MDAVVVIVGDEILQGHTRDANVHWLAKRLDELGHYVERAEIVHDRLDILVPALQLAADGADLVLVTGGLGPTHDDRTRTAVAEAYDLELHVVEPFVEEMKHTYQERFSDGAPPEPQMVEAAKRMCTVPKGAEVLENPVGAALGFALRARGASVIVLPGVPREMQEMFETGVAGRIVPDEGGKVHMEEVVVTLPEASFSDAMREVQERHPKVAVGSYPFFHAPRVRVRIRGDHEAVHEAAEDLRNELRGHVVGEAD